MWAQCSAFAVPFPHLDLALPTSLSFLSLPVLSPFLCSRCIPVGPQREERIPAGPAAGGAASRRWDGSGAGGRRGADALRAGGRGRRCGDGLAAGGAAALAPGAAPVDLVFFHFFFFLIHFLSEFFFIFYVKIFYLVIFFLNFFIYFVHFFQIFS